MKSRTSSFNSTVFQKDLTRFAPAWALYLVMLVLILLEFTGYSEYAMASSLADCIGGTSVLMMIYACLVAQLLFGDLFNSRMCNMLHAMPMRRETWFTTHLICGMLFALIPNAVAAVFAGVMFGDGWPVAAWWLLASMLEYSFFYGLAVACVMAVGSRFAQVVVYGMVNFASVIAYGFASVVYEPLLEGIYLSADRFTIASPVVQMCSTGNYLDIISNRGTAVQRVDTITLGEGWDYLAVCAVIGVVLMAVALLLYRRRKLEFAGDFIAVRTLEPVFAVVFALICGAVLTMFAEMMGNGLEPIFLAVGLVAGFFVARMLLKRTTRVFTRKAFVQVIALCAAVVLSLVLVKIDPTGITRRVPKAEDVQSVSIGSNAYSGRLYNPVVLTEDADIQAILELHYGAIHDTEMVCEEDVENSTSYTTRVGISYALKNGTTMNRYYDVPVASEAGRMLSRYYSSVERVTGLTEAELYDLAESATMFSVYGDYWYEEGVLPDVDFTGLVDAIVADCQAGTMAQEHEFHGQYDYEYVAYINLFNNDTYGRGTGFGLELYSDGVNTVNWLNENGFLMGTEE